MNFVTEPIQDKLSLITASFSNGIAFHFIDSLYSLFLSNNKVIIMLWGSTQTDAGG